MNGIEILNLLQGILINSAEYITMSLPACLRFGQIKMI